MDGATGGHAASARQGYPSDPSRMPSPSPRPPPNPLRLSTQRTGPPPVYPRSTPPPEHMTTVDS